MEASNYKCTVNLIDVLGIDEHIQYFSFGLINYTWRGLTGWLLCPLDRRKLPKLPRRECSDG